MAAIPLLIDAAFHGLMGRRRVDDDDDDGFFDERYVPDRRVDLSEWDIIPRPFLTPGRRGCLPIFFGDLARGVFPIMIQYEVLECDRLSITFLDSNDEEYRYSFDLTSFERGGIIERRDFFLGIGGILSSVIIHIHRNRPTSGGDFMVYLEDAIDEISPLLLNEYRIFLQYLSRSERELRVTRIQ